jgi:hypothetical protein
MTYVISHNEAQALGFDIAAAVSNFAAAVDAHRLTVDVPAPTAHRLVEFIVRQQGGQFTIEPPPPPPEESEPQDPLIPSITFAQLLIALVAAGWITEAEGEAWLVGTLPAPVNALIASLLPNQRFAARARAVAPSVVLRNDPLVVALGTAQGKTSAELDQFFITAAGL